jgi:hypothetical protein
MTAPATDFAEQRQIAVALLTAVAAVRRHPSSDLIPYVADEIAHDLVGREVAIVLVILAALAVDGLEDSAAKTGEAVEHRLRELGLGLLTSDEVMG